jgi:hypothetical protein
MPARLKIVAVARRRIDRNGILDMLCCVVVGKRLSWISEMEGMVEVV